MVFSPALIAFASRAAMAARIADLVEAIAANGYQRNGRAEIAVSGGSTPKALYEELSSRQLPWNAIGITLVDERWIGIDHPRSNEAFVRSGFASARGADITGLYNGAASAVDGVAALAEMLDKRRRPFDAVILGMGEDGHTASWFPYAEGLDRALNSDDTVCAVKAKKSVATGDEVERMTLTLSAIVRADLIVLLIAGEAKRAAFERACEQGPVEEMPVRALLQARQDLWACWAP